MRFQCRIRASGQAAPPVAPATPVPRHLAAKRRCLPVHSVIASAVLVAVVGCATLDPKVAKGWKIEPVLAVDHGIGWSPAGYALSLGYYTLGQYFDGSLAWDKSIDAYRKAIAADAQHIEAYNALGVALAQIGRHAEAETTLRQAVALAPTRTHIRNNLGYVLLLSGKAREALQELQAAVEQDSGNAIAKANLHTATARTEASASGALGTRSTLGAPPTPVAPAAVAARTTSVGVPLPSQPAEPATLPAMRVGFEPTIAALDQSAASTNVVMTATPESASLPMPAAAAPIAKVQTLQLEISNGNGVAGMAARVGRWLATQGLQANRLSNQQPYAQQHTVIQYRDGHADAALRVARSLPAYAKAEPALMQGLRSDVRVVIGRDWVRTAACLGLDTCRPMGTEVAAAGTP